MPRYKTKLFIFFLLLCMCCHAQQVTFIKYSVLDGMVANPVRCVYQDNKGFIWIGTYEGLSRYDGYKFTNYTTSNGLSHNVINSIIEVNDKLLIAENNGNVDIIQNNHIQKGLRAASAANAIRPFKDRILIATDENGFYEYKNDTILLPKQEKINTSLGEFVSVNDSLLLTVGSDYNFLFSGKDLSVRSVLKNFGQDFHFVYKDSKKRIWACTSGGLRLLKVIPNRKPVMSFAALPSEFNLDPLKNSQVTSIIEDKDGSFWIGTVKGLVHLFPGSSYHLYNEKDGLPSAIIYTLYRDKENNLWIGTALGLAKWVASNNVIFYNTEENSFKNDVSSIYYLGNKKVLLTTQHGLQQFDLSTRSFKDINPLGVNLHPVVGTDPLLVYNDGRLKMFDSARNILIPGEKLDSIISAVQISTRHPGGTIFLGSFGGLFAVKKNSVKKVLPYRITGLVTDNSGITWAATWAEGLFRVSIKSNEEMIFIVDDITSATGEKQIRSLYVDSKGNIWIGTRYAGAFCLTEKPNYKYKVEHFDRQFGLMSDWISSFAETENGDMWVGTYLGLDKLIKESSGYRVFNFSKAVNFFGDIKKIISAEGNEWLAVANTGIAYFKDESLHETSPLNAKILSASLGSGENKETFLSPSKKIFLNPGQNAARFEFSALGFINERQILYSYRLKGSNDTTWSKPENIHQAYYESLAPGDYSFEVKAIGWNGQDGASASFSFRIATPFWKQWWFISLILIAATVLLYGLYRYRIRQLMRLQNVRNSIATDLHDDIGSSLTNISILSELSNKNLSQPVKAQEFLQRISEEVSASSQAMDDIIWSVNSRNDSLQETLARMRRYTAELFDNSEIKCHLQLDENSSDKKMGMEQRRDVYLIYKEALNNVRKHAGANNVWIVVMQHQNNLHMEIKDDGKGFNTELLTHRNGLKNLKLRTEKWNGKINVLSQEDKGTVVEIKIPLKE
jgi:signal transduction histidine kinase/ligand-binding sensor domain-containing protein